jgi:hypothetical protein
MRTTPYVQVDAGIVDANINSMQEFCDSRSIALRPHAKTHRSVDVGRRQLLAGAAGLTFATIGEGEVFADLMAELGKDLFVAYPVAASPSRLRELPRIRCTAPATPGQVFAEQRCAGGQPVAGRGVVQIDPARMDLGACVAIDVVAPPLPGGVVTQT